MIWDSDDDSANWEDEDDADEENSLEGDSIRMPKLSLRRDCDSSSDESSLEECSSDESEHESDESAENNMPKLSMREENESSSDESERKIKTMKENKDAKNKPSSSEVLVSAQENENERVVLLALVGTGSSKSLGKKSATLKLASTSVRLNGKPRLERLKLRKQHVQKT